MSSRRSGSSRRATAFPAAHCILCSRSMACRRKASRASRPKWLIASCHGASTFIMAHAPGVEFITTCQRRHLILLSNPAREPVCRRWNSAAAVTAAAMAPADVPPMLNASAAVKGRRMFAHELAHDERLADVRRSVHDQARHALALWHLDQASKASQRLDRSRIVASSEPWRGSERKSSAVSC
jgi:hypothetical protein